MTSILCGTKMSLSSLDDSEVAKKLSPSCYPKIININKNLRIVKSFPFFTGNPLCSTFQVMKYWRFYEVSKKNMPSNFKLYTFSTGRGQRFLIFVIILVLQYSSDVGVRGAIQSYQDSKRVIIAYHNTMHMEIQRLEMMRGYIN